MNHYLLKVLLVGLNVQPPFWKFPHVPSVLDMVESILASNPLLILSLMDLFYRYQVFHWTTLQMYMIILAINHDVSLSDVDIEFP